MRKLSVFETGILCPRLLVDFALCCGGVFLAAVSFAASPSSSTPNRNASSTLPGHWEIVSSPSPGTLYNYLLKVTCVTANNCWAVGSYWNGTNDQALIEHFDGTSWSVVPSPSPGPTSGSYLVGITCLNANACWAVGSYSAASTGTIGFGNTPIGEQPLIEFYDGTAWSIVTSPPGPAYTTLRDISCVSATDCWAVGHFGGEVIATFAEHYDGLVWTIVSTPNQPSPNCSLYGVSCTSSDSCWAVGEFFNTVPAQCGENATVSTESLVEHWDGASWSIVNAPYDPCRFNLLDKIACTGGANCWAVGTKGTETSNNSTLIQNFNGSAWSIVDSPNTDPVLLNYLYGVTCAATNDCWAVGTHDIGGTNYRPMIQHFDGTAWSVADSPLTSTTYRLDDVTCTSSNNCWAVGVHNQGQTLIEHYTAPPLLASVVSRKVHGDAGVFDIDLPLGGNAIECRSGEANGDYTLIFTFVNELTNVREASIDGGAGSVFSGAIGGDRHQYIADLTNVSNAQAITVSLNDVSDSTGSFSSGIAVSMKVLVGDTTADGSVNSADISQTKSQSGQTVTRSNFREDATTDGSINSADISLVKSKSGTALP